MTRAIIIRTDAAKNGTRHPQSWKESVPSQRRVPIETLVARMRPRVAADCGRLVQSPLFLSFELSAMYVTPPPYSPPRASPCSIRSVTRASGATIPAWSYVGRSPTKTEPRPITRIVSTKAYFLPRRSPYLPKSAPPTGLTAAPATKAPIAGKMGGTTPWLGKKTPERTTTSDP